MQVTIEGLPPGATELTPGCLYLTREDRDVLEVLCFGEHSRGEGWEDTRFGSEAESDEGVCAVCRRAREIRREMGVEQWEYLGDALLSGVTVTSEQHGTGDARLCALVVDADEDGWDDDWVRALRYFLASLPVERRSVLVVFVVDDGDVTVHVIGAEHVETEDIRARARHRALEMAYPYKDLRMPEMSFPVRDVNIVNKQTGEIVARAASPEEAAALMRQLEMLREAGMVDIGAITGRDANKET